MDESVFALVASIVLPVAFLLLRWMIGRSQERRHLQSLAAREAAFKDFFVTSFRSLPGAAADGPPPELVCGEAAIASDGFKSWVFGLRNLIGGESRSFSLLFERARREAVARMVADARERGFNAVCNVRFSTVDIGGNAAGASRKRALRMAVCTVSGTAYLLAERA